MASTPTAYPVWLQGAGGVNVVVLDSNGYTAALAAGTAPFVASTPSATLSNAGGALITVAEIPLASGQVLPAADSPATGVSSYGT